LAQARRQAARRIGRQDAEERAPGRHPGERPLEHADDQVAPLKLPHGEGRKRAPGVEVGTEQDATGLDA